MRRVLDGEMEYYRIYETTFRTDSNSSGRKEQLKKSSDDQVKTLDFADMLRTEIQFVSAM